MNRPHLKPMRERNQVMVAIVGTALAALLVLMSINLSNISFLNPTTTYYADFANADGLKGGDDVRVEGISVGSVQSVKVQGDHVHVTFTVKHGLALGGQSNASIEVATILGNLFMQLESAGPGTLPGGATIPVSRTTVPYNIVKALTQFGQFTNNTDIPQLRRSLQTLAASLNGIKPGDARAALSGLASIATTVASKQNQISQILDSASAITDTLNKNSSTLVTLLDQGDQLLKLVNARQAAIGQLLTDTANLGHQVSTLIGRNNAQLTPLLANLNSVSALLASQKAKLQQAAVNLGQFSVNLANASGSGPWIDLIVPGAVEPDNVIKACGPNPNTSGGPCG
jgi:phospholipid/cholesterol/gamma-HCH transport system substrate-binding protein